MKLCYAKKIVLAAIVALVSGCTAGPDYTRPAVETPAAYKKAGSWTPAQPRDTEQRGSWWQLPKSVTEKKRSG